MDHEALIVLQARMGSSRLPGKVLAEIAGRPTLDLMLRRLQGAGVPIVVATSDRTQDDQIAWVATRAGATVFRGSERDVLGRFAGAVANHRVDHVVRMTADCPLADPELVRRALDLARARGADYVSNSLVRTYPDGLDVEVVRTDALLAAAAEAVDPDEREHVTPFVYRRPKRFRLEAFVDSRNLGHERWTVDTPEDLDVVRGVVHALPDPIKAGWEQALAATDLSVRAPLLRPALGATSAPRSHPAARTWEVHDGGHGVAGWIGIDVTDPGTARVCGDLPRFRRSEAIAALRATLAADHQVRELDVPREWTTDGR